MNIPLHSFVIISSLINKNDVNALFPEYEILNLSTISKEIFGYEYKPETFYIIQNELKHKIFLKLSVGERIIINDNILSDDYKVFLFNMAASLGASLFYIKTANEKIKFNNTNINIVNINNINVINNTIEKIFDNFKGITVIADIHGNLDSLKEAIKWATDRNHFIYFLGDIIDHGENTLSCMEMVYDLIINGKALSVIGNHEKKIAKWIHNNESHNNKILKLSEGNKITIKAIEELNKDKQQLWINQFKTFMHKSSLISTINNITLAHAAVHPNWWLHYNMSYDIEKYSLYGEVTQLGNNYFKQEYNWVDFIPKNHIVIVGHDIRSSIPLTILGSLKGQVIFLDTGSGKGGTLSTADFRFNKERELYLENFNRF